MDEAMGRSFLRQYMPVKPIKWGIKVWCSAESTTGYIVQFDVYCGRQQAPSSHGLGYDVVMKLAEPYLD